MTPLDPVFNELSSQPLAADRACARVRMSAFIQLLLRVPSYGLGPGLRIPQSFYILEIERDYRVTDWLYDPNVPREETGFVLTLGTKSPYLDHAPPEVMVREQLVEVSIAGARSNALDAAYLLDVPLVSFRQSPWDAPFIDAECLDLSAEDKSGPDSIALVNLSIPEHLDIHAGWISERRKRDIVSMTDLWLRRADLFSSLEFCPVVEDQLANVIPTDPHFRQILNKLFELQTYFIGWHQGGFDQKALTKCNPVSKETRDHKGYRQDYRFRTASNVEVVANWHLYMTPGAWRLYFDIDYKNRKGVICHIGRKLPDKTYGRI